MGYPLHLTPSNLHLLSIVLRQNSGLPYKGSTLVSEAISTHFHLGHCSISTMPGFEGRGMQLVLVATISTSIALVTVVGRFVCRHHYASQLGIDDWVIAASMVTTSGPPT